ncbi:MAG TPA: OmpA family protein [Alphaproteobacteria bacterium]|nr:OmpA family protein [Alphaproteobacteria bacterium]
MKHFTKYFVLGSAAVFALSTATAQANDRHHGFTSHHSVAEKPYKKQAKKLSPAQKLELREYLDYEEREPCQNYQIPPQPFVKNGCDIMIPHKEKKVARKVVETTTTTVQQERTTLRPVIADYKIYFDHDRHNIRESEEATLRKVSADIKRYEPYEVTIAGYADRSGPSDYNIVLSKKRADEVSRTLTGMGIPNRVLEQEAHGENDLAVPTADGVRMEENRRVEIQLRK